jgi:3',5'-cyclic AMP phosphodiesterase CpdA
MSILAHLSDLHLIEPDYHKRRGFSLRRLRLLSAGAPLHAEVRIQRVAEALQCVRRARADHLLITGDLTEDGADSQFEVLAEVLQQSGLDAGSVTVVPGNHDGYSDVGAFARALKGPLRAFRRTSGEGAITRLRDALIAPISTVIEGQWFTYAGGLVRPADVQAIGRLASDPGNRDRAIVVAQHHPLSRHSLFAMDWFDSVKNALAMLELVLERTCVYVLHGHTHRRMTRQLSGRQRAQIFSTASVRDEYDTGHSLRFYKAEEGTLSELVGLSPAAQTGAAEETRLSWLSLQSAVG